MMREIDESSQIQAVEDTRAKRYEGQIPRQRIHDEVERVRLGLASAPVRTYIPVLVQREVVEALRIAG